MQLGGLWRKAEEHGIKVKEVSEYKTSSKCQRCRSENITEGRLFKYLGVSLKGQ
jgi:transposase